MFLIFKKPEYRRFNLKPRYWDPAKEEREERERRVKAELGLKDDDKTYIPNIKGQFRQEYEKRKANRNGLNSNYALRLFMILTLLSPLWDRFLICRWSALRITMICFRISKK